MQSEKMSFSVEAAAEVTGDRGQRAPKIRNITIWEYYLHSSQCTVRDEGNMKQ